MSPHAGHPCLHAGQPGIGEPMAPQLARDRKQVQMALYGRRGAALEPVTRDEQRPVEGSPVVGHQPRILGKRRGDRRQEAGLLRLIRQVPLAYDQALPVPDASADQKGQRADARTQARCLSVEQYQWP
ncbi:MAG: hypothetical protein H0V12_07640 [Chloroflexi bacterium]|nr:hypothetical protein [Chloroflexota bacterium]